MSNEEWEREWERKMDFLLGQQAQFASDFGRLQDIVMRLATATFTRFEAMEREMAEKFGDVNAKIAALVDSQIETERMVKNLTAVIDRYFAGRNGRAEE
jgi:hypothetical protein